MTSAPGLLREPPLHKLAKPRKNPTPDQATMTWMAQEIIRLRQHLHEALNGSKPRGTPRARLTE